MYNNLRTGPITFVLVLFFSLFANLALSDPQTETLRFRIPTEPVLLDWNQASTSAETYILMNIMEGLTEEGDNTEPKAALADSWSISEDGKTYRFNLRKNVKWSDGHPLTAQQFVDSWLRLLAPSTSSSYASFLFDIENAEAFHLGKIKDPKKVGLSTPNDLTLQVRLNRRVPYFPHLTTFWVTFPIRLDLIQKSPKTWASPGKLVVLGPYQLKEWKKEKSLTLERNPLYYGPPPALARAEIVIEKDDALARQWFERGQTDLLLDVTTTDFLNAKSRIEKNQVSATQFPYLATYYLGFDTEFGPLKSPKIRRALCSTLNVTAIASALQGGQTPAFSWIPPGMAGHNPKPLQPPLSLYEAKMAFASLGFLDGKGFPKISLILNRFDGSDSLLQFITKSWRSQLGVEVDPRIATAKEYQEAIKTERNGVFVGHWGADFPDPVNFYEVFSSQNGNNRTRWSNQEYDALLGASQQASDPRIRLELFRKAEEILLYSETAICPLFYRPNTVLLSQKVQNFTISPLNYLLLKTVQLRRTM